MEQTNTDTFEIEKEFIPTRITLKQLHFDYLHTIDHDNISSAIRNVIDDHIKSRRITFEKHMLSFATGFILVLIGVTQVNILVMVTASLTGLVMIVYSLTRYILGYYNYRKEFKK